MLKNNENVVIQLNGKTYFCPVEVTMDIIGGKWTAPILWYLIENTRRYSELKRLLVTISERMLIKELKALEKHGLIERKAYPVVPPKVEYSLSEAGKSLIPLVQLISRWGEEFSKEHGKYVK